MAGVEELLACPRAEAGKRGEDWFRRLVPDPTEQPAPAAFTRQRRSRPPSRLNPSPPSRCRRTATASPGVMRDSSTREGPAPVGGRGNRRSLRGSQGEEPSTSHAAAVKRTGARSHRQRRETAGAAAA
ncbi:hypothetical protein XELAEV_18004517mg [Xenopus laevis]|uniref:Uncharacterized protein n=1 Tax=Xenopus laevis TaxID=8355 RepID=A0A974GZU5_XENLA|nr:hypothetical protein XELAEV_18004517mg [Xenopus laevis]